MALYNTDYHHWDGVRHGIWYRRATIAKNGLRGCFQGRWTRRIAVLCWCAALAQAALLFLVGQLLVTDSLIVRNLENFSPDLRNIAQGLMAWLEMHPEVSVRSVENFLFYYFSGFYVPFAMLGLGLAIPHLISRDISSQALIIYSSKAVARFDYLLGKFGTVFGLLAIIWLGPVCLTWCLGNLLAPHWHFFWHSRLAIGHSLLFMLASMVVLSLLALGVSAISGREKIPVGLWIGFWMMGGFIAKNSEIWQGGGKQAGHFWLNHLSVTFNFDHLSAAIFHLTTDLKMAQENVPLFGTMIGKIRPHLMSTWQNPDLAGAVFALGLLAILAVGLLRWRVKPE